MQSDTKTNGLLITEENGHDVVKVAVSVNKDGNHYTLYVLISSFTIYRSFLEQTF